LLVELSSSTGAASFFFSQFIKGSRKGFVGRWDYSSGIKMKKLLIKRSIALGRINIIRNCQRK
jgi:hypothetical protein